MAWRPFNWGSRGPAYDTGGGVYVATILIPSCIQVNVRGSTLAGEELLHVFDLISPTSVPSSADVIEAANMTAAWVAANFIPYVRNVDTVDEIIATSRAVVNGPQHTIPVNLAGTRTTATGVQLPAEVTIALKKAPSRAGRPYRGRFFAWPFWSSDLDSRDGQKVNATFAGIAFSTYDSLRIRALADGYPLGVASNVLAQINPVSAISLVDFNVDSQRRRGAGRGA